MGIPHEIQPTGGHTISGGNVVIAVDLPSRVKIHKVIVARTDTPGSGSFSVDVYNREEAARGSAIVDEDGNDLVAALFKVMPTIAGTSGLAAYFSDAGTGGYGFPFFNLDTADPNGLIGQNPRRVWVVVTAVAGTYAVAIGTDSDANM